MASEVFGVGKPMDAIRAIQGEKLGHVENLDTVANKLTSNDHVVLVWTYFSPPGTASKSRPLRPKQRVSKGDNWNTRGVAYKKARGNILPSGRISMKLTPSYTPEAIQSWC